MIEHNEAIEAIVPVRPIAAGACKMLDNIEAAADRTLAAAEAPKAGNSAADLSAAKTSGANQQAQSAGAGLKDPASNSVDHVDNTKAPGSTHFMELAKALVNAKIPGTFRSPNEIDDKFNRRFQSLSDKLDRIQKRGLPIDVEGLGKGLSVDQVKGAAKEYNQIAKDATQLLSRGLDYIVVPKNQAATREGRIAAVKETASELRAGIVTPKYAPKKAEAAPDPAQIKAANAKKQMDFANKIYLAATGGQNALSPVSLSLNPVRQSSANPISAESRRNNEELSSLFVVPIAPALAQEAKNVSALKAKGAIFAPTPNLVPNFAMLPQGQG